MVVFDGIVFGKQLQNMKFADKWHVVLIRFHENLYFRCKKTGIHMWVYWHDDAMNQPLLTKLGKQLKCTSQLISYW
jgi:hypothetical protein